MASRYSNYRWPNPDSADAHEGALDQKTIRGARLRVTPQRLALIKLLQDQPNPLSIIEIQAKMKTAKFSYDDASLYRTLNALVKGEVVSRINLGQHHARFELRLGRKHHHHMICEQCGYIEDIDCPIRKLASTAIVSSVSSKNFDHVTDHMLELFGLCKKCS